MSKFKLGDPKSFAISLNKPGSRLLARDLFMHSLDLEGLDAHGQTPLAELWRYDLVKRSRLINQLTQVVGAGPSKPEFARSLISELKWRQDHLNRYLTMLGGDPVPLDLGVAESPSVDLLEQEEESLVRGLTALDAGEIDVARVNISTAATANATRLAALYVLSSPLGANRRMAAKLLRTVSTGATSSFARASDAWATLLAPALEQASESTSVDKGARKPKSPSPQRTARAKPPGAPPAASAGSGASAGATRSGRGARAAPPPPEQTRVRRTPHLDMPARALVPTETVKVGVYLDTQAPTPGQVVEGVEIDVPEDVRLLDLEVRLLVSGHFQVVGSASRKLTINRERDETDPVEFSVQVRSAEELAANSDPSFDPATAYVSAVFDYHCRPVGRVAAICQIDGVTGRPQPAADPGDTPPANIQIHFGTERPEFLVDIRELDQSGRRYRVRLCSRLLEPNEIEDDWTLSDATRDIVLGKLNGFTERLGSRDAIVDRLIGAGIAFYTAAPEIFKTKLWELIDRGKTPQAITIVSAEPYIPWELMIPFRDVGGQPGKLRDALGVEFRIGRWVTKLGASPPQRIVIDCGRIVAPTYLGDDALPHVDEEVADLGARFHAVKIDPVDYKTLKATCVEQPVTLLHFACHGKTSGSTSCLDLGGETVVPDQLEAIARTQTPFCKKAPLVFLNACETGQATRALMGVGGFPQAFAHMGAAAIVAPLWAVSDETAPFVAKAFYDAMMSGKHPTLAGALASVRRKAYDDPSIEEGFDTYAAYCFFGDPEARFG